MTIADIIGPVDTYSMMVALGAGASFTIISTSLIVKQTKWQKEHEFKLAQMQLASSEKANADQRQKSFELDMARIASNREVEFQRISNGMIDLKVSSK
jgi:hypothetical protein